MTPFVSIIIAVGTPGRYVRECIEHCLALDYPRGRFEIIVLPDTPWEPPDPSVTVSPTGKVRPAEKRDRGVHISKGEIAAIIDDDAWPEADWLTNAVRHFTDPSVAAVGGPGVTPRDDTLRQKISGWTYESPLVSGGFTYRYRPGKRKQDVDDYPTSSLLIRKSDFLEAGGFDTEYWPGEDTILCLKLTHELGKRIVYDPEVVVHHHRRPIFAGHLRQIKSYALHRGFFVKHFPGTSLKLSYFIPSLFTLFAAVGWADVFIHPVSFTVWVGVMILYLLLALLSAVSATHHPIGVLGVVATTFLTHITYGFWFMKGLLSRKLDDRKKE